MSGEQMLTVGRGLWTTATDQWRALPASGLAAVIYVSDNSTLPCGCDAESSCNGRQIVCRYSTPPAQHKERHVVTLRYEARAEREARDTRTGLAAEPLVAVGLNVQMRIYTGDNPYVRNARKKTFRHLIDLRNHMTVHIGEKCIVTSVARYLYMRIAVML